MSDQPSPAPGSSGQQRFQPWEAMLDQLQDRSERRAWWCAGIASLLALTAIAGIVLLAPYRRYIPFLLLMDQVQGNIVPIGAVDQRTIKTYQDLLDDHWVRRYVVARASYFYRLLQEDYYTVMEMSDEPVAKDFAREYDGSNARDKRYGDRTEIAATIHSVQFSHNSVGDQATVRYSTITRHLDSNVTDPPQYFIVTMAYHYVPEMFGEELALIRNPMGFKASAYRPVSDLPPAAAAIGHAAATTQ